MATIEEKLRTLRERTFVSVLLLTIMTLMILSYDVSVVSFVLVVAGAICVLEALFTPMTEKPRIYVGPYGWHSVRYLLIAVVVLGWISAADLYGGEHRDMFYLGLAGAIAADICALASGMLAERFVKRPFWRRVLLWRPVRSISGGKTLAGFLGVLVFGGLTVIVVGCMINDGAMPPLWLAVVIPVAAAAGDLVASFAKRVIGAEQFTIGDNRPILGNGHGGMMDRFDSVFFTWLIVRALVFVVEVSV